MPKHFEILNKANLRDELFEAAVEEYHLRGPAAEVPEGVLDFDPLPAQQVDDAAPVGSNGTATSAVLTLRGTSPAPRPRARLKWGEALAELLQNPLLSASESLGVCPLSSDRHALSLVPALGEWMSQYVQETAVLVEANFVKPRLAAMFGVRAAPGLADALFDAGIEIDSLLRETPLEKLLVLPAGKSLSRRRRKEAGGLFVEFYKSLRKRIPNVIVSLPPADDPEFLSFPAVAVTDAVVLTLDPKRTGVRDLQKAMSKLAAAQVNVVGCLIARPSGSALQAENSAVMKGVA